jgi:hypothetical protein
LVDFGATKAQKPLLLIAAAKAASIIDDDCLCHIAKSFFVAGSTSIFPCINQKPQTVKDGDSTHRTRPTSAPQKPKPTPVNIGCESRVDHRRRMSRDIAKRFFVEMPRLSFHAPIKNRRRRQRD